MPKIKFNVSFPFFALSVIFISGSLKNNYLCALFFSFLHELSHLFALFCFGVPPTSIVIGIFGGKIEIPDNKLSLRQECITALAGPLINLFFCCMLFFKYSESLSFAVNLGLFSINMLPVRLFDGGRFVCNFILFFLSPDKAEKVLNAIELATYTVICVVFFISLLSGVCNLSFAVFCFMLIVIIIEKLCCILYEKSI